VVQINPAGTQKQHENLQSNIISNSIKTNSSMKLLTRSDTHAFIFMATFLTLLLTAILKNI